MSIPVDQYDYVRAIDVDDHSTRIPYRYWKEEFAANTLMLSRIELIENSVGIDVKRRDLIEFYSKDDVSLETKFIAAMIWGHEAPAESRRDPRGPWKLSKTFGDDAAAVAAINSVNLNDSGQIAQSYRILNNALHRCGPNFFSKHFYFLGKSRDRSRYPLIFDDRVARGLIRLSAANAWALSLVRVATQTSPDAYLRYVEFALGEARNIGCEPDQVEYYLFSL